MTIDAQADGAWMQLVVHNQGPPIDPKLLPHIFEPMQRAARETHEAD